MLPDEMKTTTLNVADCNNGVEVLVKALKKFGKVGGDGQEVIRSEEGGLSVDGWWASLKGVPGEGESACRSRSLRDLLGVRFSERHVGKIYAFRCMDTGLHCGHSFILASVNLRSMPLQVSNI